jgi:hypothetical protein
VSRPGKALHQILLVVREMARPHAIMPYPTPGLCLVLDLHGAPCHLDFACTVCSAYLSTPGNTSCLGPQPPLQQQKLGQG